MHLESDEPFSSPPPPLLKKKFQGFQSTEHFQTDGFVIYDETGENPFYDVWISFVFPVFKWVWNVNNSDYILGFMNASEMIGQISTAHLSINQI